MYYDIKDLSYVDLTHLATGLKAEVRALRKSIASAQQHGRLGTARRKIEQVECLLKIIQQCEGHKAAHLANLKAVFA